MNLFNSEINKEVIIKDIKIGGKEQKKLFEFGIIPGAKITKVFQSIFDDPKAYEIKKTIVALRNEDSKLIEVSEICD